MKPRIILCLLAWLWQALPAWPATLAEVTRLVSEGHWQAARGQIEQELARPNLDFSTRQALQFQIERMRRIQLDFDLTRSQIFAQTRQLGPKISEDQLNRWDQAGAFENLDIDGRRCYFSRAPENLFLLNREARALRRRTASDDTPPYRLEEIRRILANQDRTGEVRTNPRRWHVNYMLRVKAGVVPAGETIRAWLPYPISGDRQSDVRLLSSDPPQYLLAGTNAGLSSIYLEKPARAGTSTVFQVTFEYTATGFHQPIDPSAVQSIPTAAPELAPFLVEEPPHLVFSPALRKLSAEIVGAETNPYLKARRLFQWVYEHIPWAGAREYSNLESLTEYALANHHGDCGIQTMLFMSLCRLNGVPARWDSGWITGSGQNMHDWCRIYLAPYGWVPVDVSIGFVSSAKEREKWFYLGGIDACRLVVNTRHSQPLYPAKMFFRSEMVDFQRGEVEWRGGNLYFDQWDYDFRVQEVWPKTPPIAKSPPGNK